MNDNQLVELLLLPLIVAFAFVSTFIDAIHLPQALSLLALAVVCFGGYRYYKARH